MERVREREIAWFILNWPYDCFAKLLALTNLIEDLKVETRKLHAK